MAAHSDAISTLLHPYLEHFSQMLQLLGTCDSCRPDHDLEQNQQDKFPLTGQKLLPPCPTSSKPAVRSQYGPRLAVSIQLAGKPVQLVSAHIIASSQTSTGCCDLTVELHSPDISGTYVLRLYDRRFANAFRVDHGAGPWAPAAELELRDLEATGDVQQVLEEWRSVRATVGHRWAETCDRQHWSIGKQEAYLQMMSVEAHAQAETTMRQRDNDGHFHKVGGVRQVWLTSSPEGSGGPFNPSVDIPGILLEHRADT